ncbi:MADS-box transcription factor 57 [Acorus gramineus]|uniref:MADS-box transcription factor 57 n=1 Tax=Acorus gramineus TaxID=55184 RepID=A0AAV9AFY3_ACOGR|nr:MADS-box transcription factor 57 [Acorus gramineus]
MGRKKVKLHKIENAATRQITYAKRRDGLIKKVKEISILCDVEVGFVMISENGIGTAVTGVNKYKKYIFFTFALYLYIFFINDLDRSILFIKAKFIDLTRITLKFDIQCSIFE